MDAQCKHQKDYLKSQAEQQKAQFVMQIDMEVSWYLNLKIIRIEISTRKYIGLFIINMKQDTLRKST